MLPILLNTMKTIIKLILNYVTQKQKLTKRSKFGLVKKSAMKQPQNNNICIGLK